MRCLRRTAAAIALAALAVLPNIDNSAAQTRAKQPPAKLKAAPSKAVPAWSFIRTLGVPTLAYGIEAKDEFLISFSCQPDSGLLRVISSIGSRGLRPGDGAAIRLSNGKARFEIAGTAFATEMRNAVDIGGVTRIDPALFALFRAGDTLVVEVPGRRQRLPVADAKGAVEAFEKACVAGSK